MPHTERLYRYVPVSDVFMQEAKLVQETLAGDSTFPVGMVLVKDGQVVARGGNGFNKGPQKRHICPRIIRQCPSGVGYELCSFHLPPGHAEPSMIADAVRQGVDPRGGTAYMYGHWWCCEDCWKVLEQSGISDVVLLENAKEVFAPDRVKAVTLRPRVRFVGFVGFDADQMMSIVSVCKTLGVEALKGSKGADAVVYYGSSPEDFLQTCMIPTVVLGAQAKSLVSQFAQVIYEDAPTSPEELMAWVPWIVRQI